MDSALFLVFLVVMIGGFYFLLIRPQRKRQSEHRELIESLHKGDKVITVGGIFGEVDTVGEHDVVLKLDGGTRIKLLKTSIMGMQPSEEPDL